jgi:ribonuclease D
MINATQVLPAKFVQREAVGIASIINQNQPFSEPAEVRYLDKPLTPAYRKQLRACQNAAKDIAAELAIAPELLARKRQWVELLYRHIRGEENIWPQSMDNWRKQILESAVTAILQSDT